MLSWILPIFISGFVSIFIGWVWYSPPLFGTVWMRLSKMTPEMVERGKKRMPLVVFIAFLAGMLIAYVMKIAAIAFNAHDLRSALLLAWWLWLGFVAPTMLGTVLWEQKSIEHYIINAAYWLVTLG